MAHIVTTFVPHKGHCLAIIFDDCAFRASMFMPKADAEALQTSMKVFDLIPYISIYKDCLAVNPKANNSRALSTLRRFNIPQTAL